mgnify:CR=1 FL=1
MRNKKIICLFQFILVLTISVLFLVFTINFIKYPEKYINTWKYQLKNDLELGNPTAIELYETKYVKNGVDLFQDNFEIVENYKNIGVFTCTAYCPCYECSEGYGTITATGAKAKSNHTIAVDPKIIPYGTIVIINGIEYMAEDCGGAIKGNRIDIFFDSHEETLKFGKRNLEVIIKQ